MSAIAISKNTRFRRLALVAGVVLLTLPGVAGNQQVEARVKTAQPPVFPDGPQPPEHQHHWYQLGRASWYGALFQGQPTASGEDFDMNAMTCAHRSLPMGSLVKVTNLRNHKSVVVRVNDRGPIPANRVVDLSYAAARFLGFTRRERRQFDLSLSRPAPNWLNWISRGAEILPVLRPCLDSSRSAAIELSVPNF